MIAKTVLTLLLAFGLPLNSAADVAAEMDDDSLFLSPRHLQEETFPFGYVEPEWYDAIAASFTGVNLKRCLKRNPNGPKSEPVTGEVCSFTPKTCFFGTQTCDVVGARPETKCVCEGATWTCDTEPCPCPPDGGGFEFFNDANCPAEGFSSLNLDCSINGLTCQYGREDCCGRCNASLQISCDATFGWFGFFTDACFVPFCGDGPEFTIDAPVTVVPP